MNPIASRDIGGVRAEVWPLTFGRARLYIGMPEADDSMRVLDEF